jgi:MOB kinase activator 1
LEDKMSSFINTMFVHNSPPQPYSQSPKPLPALHSNILAESESYVHINPPANPQETYKSPLQRHLHHVISDQSTTHFTSNIPVPLHIENRTHDVQRGFRGLGHGLKDIGKQADLLTYSNSNARTRQAFLPQKRAKGSNSQQLKQFAEATLGGNSLRKVVQLPEGEDRDEWLAVNGMFFYPSCKLAMTFMLTFDQSWTSTTRSIFSMAPSPSSAPHNPAQR